MVERILSDIKGYILMGIEYLQKRQVWLVKSKTNMEVVEKILRDEGGGREEP